MRIEVRLLARLLRVPLLRLDGFIVLRDDDPPPLTVSVRPGGSEQRQRDRGERRLPAPERPGRAGRDLAEAEEILAGLDS